MTGRSWLRSWGQPLRQSWGRPEVPGQVSAQLDVIRTPQDREGMAAVLHRRRHAARERRAADLLYEPAPAEDLTGLAPLLHEPARAVQLDWPDTDADALADAIAGRREPFPTSWQLRPGASWYAKGGLTTIVVHDPDEEPDSLGRRPSDLNVGTVLTPVLAAAVCSAYNARGKAARGAQEACAAELRALMDELEVDAPRPCVEDPCPTCTVLQRMQSLALRWEGLR
jgi:hypothetical protein